MILPNKNLQIIQLLRGMAALLVVLFHVISNSKDILNANFLFGLFNFGGAGVDIFFVLSGFIISILFYKFAEKPIINRLNSPRRIKAANEI